MKRLQQHCLKSVRIWSFPGPFFPAFGIIIQNECGKIRTRKSPNTDTFMQCGAPLTHASVYINITVKIQRSTCQKGFSWNVYFSKYILILEIFPEGRFCDCQGTRNYNHLIRKQTLGDLAKLVCFQLLSSQYPTCFEQGVYWHSGTTERRFTLNAYVTW